MTTLARLPDWEARLDQVLADWHDRQMEWGVHDCAHFAVAAIESVTGKNLRAQFAQYTDETSARALMDESGGLAACVSAVLGEPESALLARRGDLVRIAYMGHEWLAVCIGQQARGLGLHGLVPARASHFKQCWRIG